MSGQGEPVVPLVRPVLRRAEVGQPVTAQAWNDVLNGVDQLYGGLEQAVHQFVRVQVTFRQGPVPGARVVGVPLAAPGSIRQVGPAVEAVPDGGDGTGFHLKAMASGAWTVYVEAPGFATQAVPADFAKVRSLAVEMVATHRFVPDVVGMPTASAVDYLSWAGFARGSLVDTAAVVWRDWHSWGGTGVLGQGTAPEALVPLDRCGPYYSPTTAVHLLLSRTGESPWRTVVPNVVGWASVGLDWLSDYSGLVRGANSILSGAPPFRVIDQQPKAGQVVPVGTAIELTIGTGDLLTATFREFAGTHRRLADKGVDLVTRRLVFDGFLSTFGWPLGQFSDTLVESAALKAPWVVARYALPDAEVAAMVRFFDVIGAPITAAPSEGLAEAWQSFRIALIHRYQIIG